MNAEFGAILGFVGILISIVAAGWMALLRYSVSTTLDGIKSKQLELEAKESKCEATVERLSERLRTDELETRDLKGKIPLLEVRHENIERDVSEIRATQVPRAEWERQMTHMSSRLDEIMRKLERTASPTPGRYGSGSSDSGGFTPPQKTGR
ncbi:MAG TPA: hypothetical protein VGQ38_15400 [Gaiellaceae bacterium]|jgi:chromosome segregation ATPase|nr:hypothetical protein [Gaiellaceae bacterium]